MTRDDRLQRWAHVASEMRKARREILEGQGFTETTWREFEESLANDLPEQTETEYGPVQVVTKPLYQRRIGDKRIGERKRIFLGRKDGQE